MPGTPLHVLVVEDTEEDSRLILGEIQQAGYEVDSRRVETGSALRQALAGRPWDVIICDYTLRHFSAMEAIDILNGSRADIPLIIVSGTIGEESAVAALKAGASDFLIKGRLARLAPAIARAIESKRHDRQLHNAEQRLADILQHASEAIVAVNGSLEIVLFNKAAEETFGYAAEDALGQPLEWLIPARVADVHREHVGRFLSAPDAARRIQHRGELVARRKDGSEFPVEIGLSKMTTEEGILITAMIVDITERKRAEEAVRQMQERFRGLTEHAPDGIALIGQDGQVQFLNPSAWSMLGYDPADKPEFDPAEVIHPDDLPRLAATYASLLDRQIPNLTLQFRFRHKDGAWLWIEGSFTNLLHLKGVEAIVINFRNITERRQAEAKIQEQLERLTALREVDQLIASTFDLRMSLEMLLSRSLKLLETDAAAVLLLDPVQNVLRYQVGIGFRTSAIQRTKVAVGKSLAGRVALERQIVQVRNVLDEPDNPLLSEYLKGEDFLSYYGAPLIVKGKLIGVLEAFHRTLAVRDRDWLDFFNTLAGQAALLVDNAQLFNELQHSNVELSVAYDATIEGWSRALDLRDKETEGHTRRVMELTMKLARQMGFPDDELVQIRRGALLHDIGKLGVPDDILFKAESLTEAEWEIMRKHPVFAYQLLLPIRYLRSAALEIPYCHHERWDGSGYPRGLKGNEIPLAARVFAVVDVWDALTSTRPYRPAWTKEKAGEYIQENSGKYFDPRVVAAFFDVVR